MKIELFDSHAHYNDEKFNEDREEIINLLYQFGVTKIINAGYSLESSKKAVEIAKKYSWMYAICGISPNDITVDKTDFDNDLEKLRKYIIENKYVESVDKTQKTQNSTVDNFNKILAIGEIGLDYYWNKENKELQKYCFKKQIELANELKLPIVIHTRDAIDDTIDILKNQIKVIKKGVFHCCPLNRELIKQALNLDFYISFAGPITFKNAKNADEMIEMVPLDKIIIETDSPYLSPEPNRGKRNDSRNIYYVAEKIAKVKNMSLEEIANITYENTKKVFEIK